MRKISYYLAGLIAIIVMVSSCQSDDFDSLNELGQEVNELNYQVEYSKQQIANWETTGSPFLENELDNSANTLIDSLIPSHGGVFKPIPDNKLKAYGVNPYQNRFWSMIRLKLGNIQEPLRSMVIMSISIVEQETNIRFYNAILDTETHPVYGFQYPNVHISQVASGKIGSTYIGRQGGEQYIYLPQDASVGFIVRALCNVAGMYNEQQRNDRDSYVNIDLSNVSSVNRYHFNKITSNYYSIGNFDINSITLAGTNEFGTNSIRLKNGAEIIPNDQLSSLDRSFLNYFYLPYIARSDTYRELDNVVFDRYNNQLSAAERLQLQAYLNNGNPYPPAGGRINPVPW